MILRIYLLLVAAIIISTTHQIALANPAWIELGPNGKIIARSITENKTCPVITIDNKTATMQIRAQANKDFPIITCEAVIPPAAKNVKIAEQRLKLPNLNPQRLIIIGDTGCRLKLGAPIQNCNDPNQWPFAKIAAHAAAFKPDLVIHLGDYIYRERACPFNYPGCAGSPYGDNWSTWQADFFHPVAPLLQAAPWVMVRGNHEDCHRAGQGWFRFLDSMTYTNICNPHSSVFSIPLAKMNLFVMDSSEANDYKAIPTQVKLFIRDFREITNTNKKNIWLLTHKPIWAIADQNEKRRTSDTLEAAAQQALPNTINLLLAGHVHRFEVLNFASNRPPQVIVGDSGTLLDTVPVPAELTGYKILSAKIAQGISIDNFGYMSMEKTNIGWRAQVRNIKGKVMANCNFKHNEFNCIATD